MTFIPNAGTYSVVALAVISPQAWADSAFDFDFNLGNGVAVDPAPDTFGNHWSDWSHISGYPYASSFEFSDGGLEVSVEAGVSRPRDNDGYPSSDGRFQGGDDGVYVGQFPGGLGVGFEINPGDIDDDRHTVDDRRGNDFLVLSFSETVWLQGLDFSYYSHGGDFQLYRDSLDGELLYDSAADGIPGGIDGIDNPNYSGIVSFDLPGFEGSTFVIQAGSIGEHDHEKDYFKLEGAFGHVTVVPSPTAAIGSLAMLGLMGVRSSRRQ